MEYKEQLQKKEWEAKRYEILDRDKYTCQDCGCMGINNNIFFPISNISNLNILLPDILLNDSSLESFLNGIDWKGIFLKFPFRSRYQVDIINKNIYFYETIPYSIFDHPLLFIAGTKVSSIHYNLTRIENINLSYKDRKFKGIRLVAYLFKEDMGQANYAAINHYCVSGEKCMREILELSILFENKYFRLTFPLLHFFNEEKVFGFTPLNIHHKYYIYGKEPWEYDNEALVTLCTSCHQKRHSLMNIPLYTFDKRLINPALPICDRCQGTGYLPNYHYYLDGVCFKCHGEGVCGYQ